jgi:hypothetical protein
MVIYVKCAGGSVLVSNLLERPLSSALVDFPGNADTSLSLGQGERQALEPVIAAIQGHNR